ncbi:YbaN family protein [uncultured Ruthenibacterium sp.]|uniref:YbaN family protein n=1 Tax=uncultured Ruthenibacterium sp. TaxID=1905347 RepID=UPI00349EB5F9
MKTKKVLYLTLGWFCLALGTLGVAIPLLPTVPFYLATVFCFSRGSQRMHDWFLTTKLYQNFVIPFREKNGMPFKNKITIMLTVTLLLGFGFWMMDAVPVGRAVLAFIWVGHLYIIFFRVRTLPRTLSGMEKVE